MKVKQGILEAISIMGIEYFIRLYRDFSTKAFGPISATNNRERGVIEHIKKELIEIRKAETQQEKMNEWIDIILLGIDGAWRTGCSPTVIAKALWAKYKKNKKRDWPDWREVGPNKAVEHRRGNND